jgi:hypothetical protein
MLQAAASWPKSIFTAFCPFAPLCANADAMPVVEMEK